MEILRMEQFRISWTEIAFQVKLLYLKIQVHQRKLFSFSIQPLRRMRPI